MDSIPVNARAGVLPLPAAPGGTYPPSTAGKDVLPLPAAPGGTYPPSTAGKDVLPLPAALILEARSVIYMGVRIRSGVCLFVSMAAALVFDAALWAESPDSPGNQETFNPNEYPPGALSQLMADNPCKGTEVYEVKDVLFRAELTYRSELRSTPFEMMELLKRWIVTVNLSGQADPFSQEASFQDGDTQRWIVVPGSILSYLKQDLKAGDKATFFMSFVGCALGKPLFAVEEYSAPNYEDLEEGADSYVA